ncbi:MAG: hypothetical protein QME57_02475 [Patescibacteria group bacterium]|nr:hypothetical protein [Patescibacteria group bacterium]
MPVYQTAEAIREIIIPTIELDRKYTGEISRRENLMDKVKEKWGDLLYPNIEIIPPTVEYPKVQPIKEEEILILPERLTNPHYGSAELEQNLKEIAKKAPGIEKIWEITKDLPSLTKILLEEREQDE